MTKWWVGLSVEVCDILNWIKICWELDKVKQWQHCLEFPIARFCRVLMSFDVMFASVMWIRGMCVTLVFNSLKYFSGSFLYVSLLWLASCLFIWHLTTLNSLELLWFKGEQPKKLSFFSRYFRLFHIIYSKIENLANFG